MRPHFVAAFVVVLLWAAPASAQIRFETACEDCREVQQRISRLEDDLRGAQRLLNAATDPKLRSDYSRAVFNLENDIAWLRKQLDDCPLQCNRPPANDPPRDPPPPPDADLLDQMSSPPIVRPACPECQQLYDEWNRLLAERRRILGVLDRIADDHKRWSAWEARYVSEYEELRKSQGGFRPGGARAGELADNVERLREALERAEESREIWEREIRRISTEILRVQEEYRRCNAACRTQTGALFRNPRLIGGVGGALVLGGVLLNGGGPPASVPVAAIPTPAPTATTPPVSTAPPVTTPPTTSPPPAATPPPATPTADGTYVCGDCGVISDEGGHNQFVGLCTGLTGPVTVRQGSITISHAAPFVPVTGDYDTTTGAFTATGRGTVAGFPNVGVRAEGTVNSTTGRITMTYTMGTNGELPGGRAITYRLTLQKQ